ncbi:MAG: 23S rRNA (pseudouridine(1915)-N(3))-methyltransferase RlmH [Candidatus Saccharibacteria bacterium]|nr:23S rRNA (pseudouridine(1915)-N(3))-methyltransferase RlmH [Candidatus Saccharibacteria bacterium]
MSRREVVILVGGAYGFDENVREKADFVWSFSKLVFPHMIARLIVAEQTYRAQEIFHNHPYHHE